MISTGSISVLALIIQSLDLNTASVELMCTIIAGTDAAYRHCFDSKAI
jgi:hypothetical protein